MSLRSRGRNGIIKTTCNIVLADIEGIQGA